MPPLPPDAAPFLDAVADDPDDSTRRLVFADWLEEQGRPGAAAACRWLAAGNMPYLIVYPDDFAPWIWHGWDLAFGPAARRPESAFGTSVLPKGLRLERAVSWDTGQGTSWWDFETREDAELALLEAWPDDLTGPTT